MKTKAILGAAALALSATAALADFPERTINVTVPFVAGGGTDVPARFFAAEMEELLGQNIVVTNVDGAGGTIGATQVSKADPSGYNLLFAPVGTMTTQPHLRRTEYNVDSWTPICMVSEGPYYLVVKGGGEVKSLDDYIALAKAGNARFVGAGPGSMDHVAQMTLDKKLGITSLYLPTSGGPNKATEINGGRADISVWFADYDSSFGFDALGILADSRSDSHPDVPTLAEQGYDVQVAIWFGLFAQDDTPKEAVDKLSSACGEAVTKASFIENMAGANRLVRYMDKEKFGAFYKEQFNLNGELMRDAGLLK